MTAATDRTDSLIARLQALAVSDDEESVEGWAFELIREAIEELTLLQWVASGWHKRGNWKPIQTAPKDGTPLLLLAEGSKTPKVVRWLDADDKRASFGGGWYRLLDDTSQIDSDSKLYWMVCPDLPDPEVPDSAITTEEKS